jgi:hypothetical protein
MAQNIQVHKTVKELTVWAFSERIAKGIELLEAQRSLS